MRTNTAGRITKFVRPPRMAWDLTSSLQMDNLRELASPLSSNSQSLGALARKCLQVTCCLPGTAHTGAADILGLHQELLWPRSKMSINKYAAGAEGWAATVKLQPQASAVLTSSSFCAALGNK